MFPTYINEEYHPFAPDGSWVAPWPPEVWVVKHRLKALGYKPQFATMIQDITDRARQGYLAIYGHEPPRRGKRGVAYTIVFDHDRIGVVDAACAYYLGPAPKEG